MRLSHLSSFEPQEFASNPRQVIGNHRSIISLAQSSHNLSVGLCFGADGSSSDWSKSMGHPTIHCPTCLNLLALFPVFLHLLLLHT